ncbi:hypothetical protein CkaCkLH20_04653 [Colletotrichum karsti]|uniref:Uncharacterized protein n=1 Tax=Colletotrichum karsti TaxID=1095194 RepID=A0A9P6I978_9PEZI|nr:uncharacterized protein CkaCkLH20_04653 [Colletotrichum karsti]KAF9878077.1 hypothetical protein CkaCkLH20_04653 [Colletotrichum karsti]
MATHQNTFSVISNGGGSRDGAPGKPPMTSKQAQNLYKQANKVPRRTKAEQRKWEKERQEELKKELERERAAVKAKQARERKKAKEEEARENRRRQGQPLVDCRPSQDTIARFVRGNGTNRKRDSSGESIPEEHTNALSEAEPLPLPLKKSKITPPQPVSPPDCQSTVTSMPPPPRPSQKPRPTTSMPMASHFKAPSAPKAAPGAPSMRAPPIFKAPVVAPTQGRTNPPVIMPKPASKPKPKPFMMPRGILPAQIPARQKSIKQEKANPPLVKDKSIEKGTEEKKAVDRPLKPPEMEHQPGVEKKLLAEKTPPIEKHENPSEHYSSVIKRSARPTERQNGEPRPKPKFESSQMPPPPRPLPRVATPQISSPKMPPPPLPTKTQMPPPQAPPDRQASFMPPPSTQAIIQDCFDDFFPTASQLAMELEDDGPESRSRETVDRHLEELNTKEGVIDENGPHLRNPGAGSRSVQNKGQGATDHYDKKPLAKTPVIPNDHRRLRQPLSDRHNGPNTTLQSKLPSSKQQQAHALRQESRRGPPPFKADGREQAFSARSTPIETHPTTNDTHKKTAQHRNLPQQTTPIPHKPRSVLRETNCNRVPEVKGSVTTKPAQFDDFFPLICTQDLMMSSQEVMEIESPARMDGELSSGGTSTGREYQPSPLIEMDLAAIDWDDDLDDF